MESTENQSTEVLAVAEDSTQHVVVMVIPIRGDRGDAHSRSIVLNRAPTKEGTLKVLQDIYDRCIAQSKPSNGAGWLSCMNTIRSVPEELFSRLNQRRTSSITFLCSIVLADGTIARRVFSARVCGVRNVPD